MELHLYAGRYIAGRIRLNHREQPPLVLNPGGEAKIRAHPIIPAHAGVSQGPALRDKLMTYFLMSKFSCSRLRVANQ